MHGKQHIQGCIIAYICLAFCPVPYMSKHKDNSLHLSSNTPDLSIEIAEICDKPLLEACSSDSTTYRYPGFSHMRNIAVKSQRRTKSISNSSFFRLLWRSKVINPVWQLHRKTVHKCRTVWLMCKVCPIAKADRALKRCLSVCLTDYSLLHCSVGTENLSCAQRVCTSSHWIYEGVGETKDLPLETASFTWTRWLLFIFFI